MSQLTIDLDSFYTGALLALGINPGQWARGQLKVRTKSDDDAHGAVRAMAAAPADHRVQAAFDWLAVRPEFRRVVE